MLLKFSEKITVGAAETNWLVVPTPEANTPRTAINTDKVRLEKGRRITSESYTQKSLTILNSEWPTPVNLQT